MVEKTAAADDPVRELRRFFRELGPTEDRYERFLTHLHGAGWKQRALATNRLEEVRGYGRRLRAIEDRLQRIEAHLKLTPEPEQH